MTNTRRYCLFWFVAGIVLFAECTHAQATPLRNVTVAVQTQTATGQPMPQRCVAIDGGSTVIAVRTDGNGEASAVVQLAAGQSELFVYYYNGGFEATWVGLPDGSEIPDCGIAPLAHGFAIRWPFRVPVVNGATEVTAVLRPVEAITVSGRIVSAEGDPIWHGGAAIVGILLGSRGMQDGTVMIRVVPKDEAAMLSVSVNGERLYIPIPSSQADIQLGDIVVSTPPRTAPVRILAIEDTQPLPADIGGSVTLVSTDGQRVYCVLRTTQGWSSGPRLGDAVLFAPGEYIVLPGVYSSPRITDLITRIRSGDLSGTSALPHVTAVANEVRSVSFVTREVEKEIRKALLTPQQE